MNTSEITHQLADMDLTPNQGTTVLVTGAGGFTGGCLRQTLKSLGYEVISMVHRSSGQKGEVAADLSDPEFPLILKTLPPAQVVVHLGARIGWDGGRRSDLFAANVLATAQLAEWSKRHGAYFIFASAALIAGEKTRFIKADARLATENDYLYGKWLAEEIIKMSGVRHAILRLAGIFGLNGPSHLGLNRAIASALAGCSPIQYGNGLNKRNYIYVRDACQAIIHCIQRTPCGILQVAGTHADTIAGMLQTICDILLPGRKPDIQPGKKGYDQIVESSPELPETRTFRQAVLDICHTWNHQCV